MSVSGIKLPLIKSSSIFWGERYSFSIFLVGYLIIYQATEEEVLNSILEGMDTRDDYPYWAV